MIGGAAVLTVAGMRAAEQAIFDGGSSEYALMEIAAAGAAEIIWRVGGKRDALILAGPGNNGGDGFVIARILRDKGLSVRVAALGESRAQAARTARKYWDGPVEDLASATPASQLVDCLFGTGLSRGLDPLVADRLCQLVALSARSYAVDLPSGVDTDSGALLSDVPRFGITIAIGALKPAHVLQPAAALMGQIVPVPIGIATGDAPVRALAAPHISAPPTDAHKYKRGMVVVVAGDMPGAAVMAANAAARSGAGYIKLQGEASEGLLPSIVRVQQGEWDERTAAFLVGPGLGREAEARIRLDVALDQGKPTVVDADGLLALRGARWDALPSQCVLTPHEGEFKALFGDLPGSKIDRALTAAARSGAVVVYKGPDTVVAAPDGRADIAWGASTWLSTAGTGDLLAGIIAARLAVTGDAFQAARQGVWLHQEAARRAGSAFSADDLAQHLPSAIATRG